MQESSLNRNNDWYSSEKNESVGKYPIIWNTSRCEMGECKNDRIVHRWSLPFTTACGLTSECYDCSKTREVQGCDPKLWVSKQGEWAKNRMIELGMKGVTSSNE